MPEFIIPEFLKNHSTNQVHQKMKDILPADLDCSEGSHTWNFTRPTALVVAELCEFVLPEVIKLIFPEWSYGQFVDAHAQTRGMVRKAATAATGTLLITGAAGTVIPVGSLFSTASVNEEPSVSYRTTEEAVIPAEGEVEVPIQCTQTGIVGNTTPDTILFVGNKITGITAVTNPEEVTAGTETESDEALIDRIVQYDWTQGESFVGNVADYKRWAESVDGVGAAVIIPANDDTGLVTIILIDANGQPANQELCQAVYDYIMRPEDEYHRLAPVNAYLSVIPPETLVICVKATVELEYEATLESVLANFMAQLALYIPEALEDKEIKYSRVWAVLSDVQGVNDHIGLEIGLKQEDGSVPFGIANIPITPRQLPVIEIENLLLTPGTVY